MEVTRYSICHDPKAETALEVDNAGGDWVHFLDHRKEIESLRKQLKEARDGALEEAAKACEAVNARYPHIGHQYVCGNNDGKYDSAAAVRALKSPEVKG